MEFHDALHGKIIFENGEIRDLVQDLLKTTELQRLRNMRQMNFDVTLIQELGKSRRLPHSIGVAYIAHILCQKAQLGLKDTKELIAAALLHDAAIPPYGHLVETEFKQCGHDGSFNHAKILRQLILGNISHGNSYAEILPGRQIEVCDTLRKLNVSQNEVLNLVAPTNQKKTPIAADIDLDNIDNVHRMAVLLGWDNARENAKELIKTASLHGLDQLRFSVTAAPYLKQWLSFREQIYTMIIAHSECIAQNALQADLVELAVQNEIVTPDNWYISEPEFEERLRASSSTKRLAEQLLSGCQYHLIDYVWFKNIRSNIKLNNSLIKRAMSDVQIDSLKNTGYFVWHEKGLINRKITWLDDSGKTHHIGNDTRSCLVAIVRHIPGLSKEFRKPRDILVWRKAIVDIFSKLADTSEFDLSYPENYSGMYYEHGTENLGL